jgi:chromosome segregation ATPase
MDVLQSLEQERLELEKKMAQLKNMHYDVVSKISTIYDVNKKQIQQQIELIREERRELLTQIKKLDKEEKQLEELILKNNI